MIELISFHSRELGTEFISNELVSFISIPMAENDRMTKMHGMWKIRHRKNTFNLVPSFAVHVGAKKD